MFTHLINIVLIRHFHILKIDSGYSEEPEKNV
jgi:hypothetical protein